MPTIRWRIDDSEVVVVDRAGLGITLKAPDQADLRVPPRTLGEWPVRLAGRSVVLRVVRNLDAVRFQLWSDGCLVPRGKLSRPRQPPPRGAMCGEHPAAAAVCACARCGRALCAPCAPEGIHCRTCLAALAAEEVAHVRRLRRLGFFGGLAVSLAVLAMGVVLSSPRVVRAGLKACLLTGVLAVVGLIAERRDALEGKRGWKVDGHAPRR
jgi:hypothetical protein